MIMTAILFACMAPVPLILFFILRNEAKPKKNLILGVTLPLEARTDARVQAVVRRFLTWQTALLIGVLLLSVPPFFFASEAVVMLWYFTWVILLIMVPNVPYIAANKELKALKQDNGWFSESTGLTLVDISLAQTKHKPLSVWLFLPTMALGLVPVAHTQLTLRGQDEYRPLVMVYLMFFLMAVLFYFTYRLVFRQRAEVVDGNSEVNAALTRVRRYNWSKSWLVIAWLTSLLDLYIWLSGASNSASIVMAAVIYTALLLGFLMRAEFKTRRIQQKLTSNSGRAVYTDDDEHWLFGMLYNNPNDSHFMVNKRTGIGTTVNMAKAPAKLLTVLIALLLLSMPGVGLWMLHEEKTPVRLELTGTELSASHTKTEYTIDITDIRNAYLLYRLPNGVRTNGTAMSAVLKGSFRYEGLGSCRLCLDPRLLPFIVVVTEERTYILGASNPAETAAVFQTLQSLGLTSPELVNQQGGN